MATSGRPRAVLLRGMAGVGKSRLAMGLAERAHALGLAEHMRADHGPVPFATQGVVPMLARYLRCEGLDGPGLHRHLDDLVRSGELADPTMAAATARLLLGGERGGPVPYRSVQERYDAIVRLLGHLGSRRPMVLILDDAQWGADALELAGWLLARPPKEHLPVLVVLGIRDDELRTRPEAAALVEDLAALGTARTVGVGPLAPSDHQALVGGFLPMQPDLTRRVAERTAGNPLFAERLVGDWVRRGLLRSTPEGFRIGSGAEAALPDDLHEMWRWSLQLVLSDQPPGTAPALWVAAALGIQVDEEEWSRACATMPVSLPDGLVEALIKAGVAVPSAGGWSFQHGMARESLRRDAEEQGAWARVHAACAAALDAEREPERVGLHNLQAGRTDEALALLVLAAERLSATCAPREALAVLQHVDEAVERLALPGNDPRLAKSWRPRFVAMLSLGQFPAADQHAARCAQVARRQGWTESEADAFRWRGMVAEKRGDLLTAETMFDRGREVAEAGGHERALAACLEHQGTLLRQRGDREGSLRALDRARSLYEALGFQLGLADCLKELGGTHAALSAPQEAVAPLRAAEALYVALGHETGRAYCLNNLGEVLRRRADLDGAERAYTEALQAMEKSGVHARIVPLLNLGLVRIARGEHVGARDTLEQALKLARAERRQVMAAYCHGFLLPCLAGMGDWEQVQAHLDEARGLLEETGLVDADLARCAREAAELARGDGDATLAAALRALAVDQEQRLEGARQD
ncbi:tetratricopeptide repeat protein [Myxococcota bacterium]|nr:tetratricopeptide repeat protein [Myxococcota bacterium]